MYWAPVLRVSAKAAGLAWVEWKGSYTGGRSGRVSGVVDALWVVLAAELADAVAVRPRHRSAPAKGSKRQETLTRDTVQANPARTRLSFPKLYDLPWEARRGRVRAFRAR